MARKLCARAQEIKAGYERNTTSPDYAGDANRAAVYAGAQYTDRLAMARALEGHTKKCRLCS